MTAEASAALASPAEAVPLLPTSHRLTDAARVALAQIMKREPLSSASINQLRVIDAILVELEHRNTGDAYAKCYAAGKALLQTRAVPMEEFEGDAHIDRATRFEEISHALGHVASRLTAAGKQALIENDGEFLRAAMDWEASVYALRLPIQPVAVPAEPARLDLEGMEAYLAKRGLTLKSHNKIVGGFQKDTIMLSVLKGDATLDLVVRAERADRFVKLDAGNVVDEYEIVKSIHDRGGTVAAPMWVEPDASLLGASFMVSERIIGRTPSTGLVPETLTPVELRHITETLADLHSLDVEAFRPSCIGHWLDHPTLAGNTKAAVAAWHHQIWTPLITASPTSTIVLDWLVREAPERDEAPVLLHVDYGPHNMIMRDGQVAAVLDWESARIGDRTEDLSYLLLYLGSRADREALIRWYEDRARVTICRRALHYFDVYNTIKMTMGSAFANALIEHDRQAAIEWCHVGFYTIHQGIAAARALLGPHLGCR